MTQYATNDLLELAGGAIIWEEMGIQAIATGQPGDGRHEAFMAAADYFRAEFDRVALEMEATQEQIAAALDAAKRFQTFARHKAAEAAGAN